jgi:hypothetical protein
MGIQLAVATAALLCVGCWQNKPVTPVSVGSNPKTGCQPARSILTGADSLTGNQLLKELQADKSITDNGLPDRSQESQENPQAFAHDVVADAQKIIATTGGQSYIDGVAESLTADNRICPGEHVTLDQIVDIVKNSLVQHPETRHLSAAYLVEEALTKAFPCGGKQ